MPAPQPLAEDWVVTGRIHPPQPPAKCGVCWKCTGIGSGIACTMADLGVTAAQPPAESAFDRAFGAFPDFPAESPGACGKCEMLGNLAPCDECWVAFWSRHYDSCTDKDWVPPHHRKEETGKQEG